MTIIAARDFYDILNDFDLVLKILELHQISFNFSPTYIETDQLENYSFNQENDTIIYHKSFSEHYVTIETIYEKWDRIQEIFAKANKLKILI